MPRPSCVEHVVRTRAGNLNVHLWGDQGSLTVVSVHPWAPLGGGEHNTVGVCKALAAAGLRAISFDLRSSSLVWGVLSNHRSEVDQVVDVADWAARKFGGRVILFGSSAGSPQAGSALDKHDSIAGLACVGYTFGTLASIGFGRHFGAVLRSTKPRYLIMGDADEFTSEATFHKMLGKATPPCEGKIIPQCGHFELESPMYDGQVAELVLTWVAKTFPADVDGAAAAGGSASAAE